MQGEGGFGGCRGTRGGQGDAQAPGAQQDGGCRGQGDGRVGGHWGCWGGQKARGGAGGDTGTRENRGMGGTPGGVRRDQEVQGDRGAWGGHRGMQGGTGNVGLQMQRDAGPGDAAALGDAEKLGGTLGGHPETGDHWCWWHRRTGAQRGWAVPPPGQHPPNFGSQLSPQQGQVPAGPLPDEGALPGAPPPTPQIYNFYFSGFRRHQRHGAGLTPAAAALPISLIYGSTPKQEEEEEEGGWGLR